MADLQQHLIAILLFVFFSDFEIFQWHTTQTSLAHDFRGDILMAIRRLSDISYDQLIARPRKLASSQSCCGFSPDCKQNILTALFCPWRIATSLSTDLRSEWETPYGDGSIYGWETDHLSSYMTENYTFPYPIPFSNPWCTIIFMSPGKTQQRVISFRNSRPARFFLTLLSWARGFSQMLLGVSVNDWYLIYKVGKRKEYLEHFRNIQRLPISVLTTYRFITLMYVIR